MEDTSQPQDGALPFSDVTGLLAAAASAEKQQALVARIFLPPPADPNASAPVDQYAQLSSAAKQLQHFFQEHTRSSDYIDGHNYIWHREAPSISVICPPSSSRGSTSASSLEQPPHILFHLRTGGECIEDEWFATHLLIRASTRLAQLQLCISVEDEDGQFLLIEAADHLPGWVTPEVVANRVWIFDGHLHLIPPHHNTSDNGAIAPSRAVELVRDGSTPTRASDDTEAAAFARSYEFPSAATPHHHRTLAYLPRRIGRVLTAEPQLIASCVTSIQARDLVSSRSGSKLVHLPPPSQPSGPSTAQTSSSDPHDNDIILMPVHMTRHLYAQLLYDRFFPPRQLGPQWQAAVEKYRMRLYRPPSSSAGNLKIEDESEVQAEMRQGRWYDLGAKIWCGLEMAYSDSLARRTRTKARPMAPSESAIPAQQRERLVSSLTKLGYFQGEIAGSAKWKELEAEALAKYAKQFSSSVSGCADDVEETLLCGTVDEILQDLGTDSTSLKSVPSDAFPETLQAAEDDDAWLQLNPADIQSILQSKTNTTSDASANPISEQDTFERLGAFNSKMEDFIKTKSDVGGALFQDEVDADDMLLDDEDLLFEDLDEEEQEERIRKEVEERMRSGGEEGKRKIVERLIPKMSQDEWTRKPELFLQNEQDKAGQDFLSSIDRIAAERNPATTQPAEGAKELTRGDNLSAAHDELRRRLASQYMRETSSLLSSQGHQRYDGASDSDSEELEQETSPEIRKKRAEEYDIEPDPEPSGAPSGEEGSWEDVPGALDDEETEMNNLLEYARISLGLTKEQYADILAERQREGRYVPSQAPRSEQKPPEPAKLDTFESVMAAMESELRHLRATNAVPPPSSSSASPSASDSASHNAAKSNLGIKQEEMGGEDEELLAHLLKSGSDLPTSLLSRLGQESDISAEQMDGFLRSFQAQSSASGPGSGSGPVELLMRRFGLGALPADQDSVPQ